MKQNKGKLWVSSFVGKNATVYFNSLGIKYISQEVLSKTKGKSMQVTYLGYNLMTLLSVNFIALLS